MAKKKEKEFTPPKGAEISRPDERKFAPLKLKLIHVSPGASPPGFKYCLCEIEGKEKKRDLFLIEEKEIAKLKKVK